LNFKENLVSVKTHRTGTDISAVGISCQEKKSTCSTKKMFTPLELGGVFYAPRQRPTQENARALSSDFALATAE
jgi:hypothetical protein